MPSKKPKTPRSWIVRMRCEIVKEVFCKGCSEQEARENPWDYSSDETEIEQTNWEIESVRSND